jgi:hypothetical protein
MSVEAISPALPDLLAWAELDPEDRMSPIAQQAFRAGWEAAGRSAEPVPAYEQVNHPQHYQMPGGIEVIDVAGHMSFSLGNVIKYVCRADLKGKDIEDLEKAAWYLQWEIERRKRVLG